VLRVAADGKRIQALITDNERLRAALSKPSPAPDSSECDALRGRVEELERALADSSDQRVSLQGQLVSVNQIAKSTLSENADLRQQLGTATAQLDDLRDKLQETTRERDKEKGRAYEFEVDRRDKGKQIEAYERQVAEMRSHSASRSGLSSPAAKQQSELSDAGAQIAALTPELEPHRTALRLKTENEKASDEIEGLGKPERDTKQHSGVAASKQQVRELQNENGALKQQVRELRNENGALKQQIQQLKSKNKALQTRLEQMGRLSSVKEQAASLRDDWSETRKLVEEGRDNFQALCAKRVDGLAAMVTEFKELLIKCGTIDDEVSAQLRQVDGNVIEQLGSDLAKLQAELATLHATHTRTRSVIDELQRRQILSDTLQILIGGDGRPASDAPD
jgi:chromosome segregation ATPase